MSNHDTAEAGLIDISRYRVADLGAETDESGLGRAVRRILTADDEGAHRGFSNTI
jgi:hypothetical protein